MNIRSHTSASSLLLLAAVALGLYARFHALGKSPLAIDEYYLAQSIRNILEEGLPRFDCGGYYVRGLIQQYVTAGLAMVGLDMHIALRLITVLANIAAIPAVYLLGKRLGGINAATAACILFALSIWEIEMARFGRMYAPFQAIFVWYCIALCNAYLGSKRGFYWSVLIGTITIFVYEGAALLLFTTFIPLLVGKVRGVKNWLLAVSSFIFGAWFLTRGFGAAGEPKLAEDFPGQTTAGWNLPIDEPSIPFSIGLSTPFEVVTLMAAVALSIFIGLTAWKAMPVRAQTAPSIFSFLWLGLTIWLAAMGFFGIIVVLTAVLVIWRLLDLSKVGRPAIVMVCAWVVACLIAWVAFLLRDSDGSILQQAKETVYALLLFPDFYSEVAYPWARSLPVVTVVAAFSIGIYFLAVRRAPQPSVPVELFRFVAGLLLSLCFLVAILPQPYTSLRYTYFLHPLVLVLVAVSWTTVAARLIERPRLQSVAVLGATLLLMIMSVDYSLDHMTSIGSSRTIYRMEMSKWDIDRVYRRWDYRTPAEYVNAHAGPSEEIVTTSHSVPYYLDRIDYFYASSSGKEYATIASCRGTKERWSFGDLLSTPDELRQLHTSRSDNGLWAILRAPNQPEAAPIEQEIATDYAGNIVYESVDKRLIVLHIPGTDALPD